MAYSLHDLRIKGIEAAEIVSCSIEGRMGEHGSLFLEAYPKGSEGLLYELPDWQPVEVCVNRDGKEQSLFCGVITQISMEVSAGMRVIRLEGKSCSLLMDITRKSRSFQDVGMSYQCLLSQIMADYPGSSLIYAAAEAPLGALTVQYEETDWEFLKRVMSRLGMSVTPECRRPGIMLYAGIPAFAAHRVPYILRNMTKDMEMYYYLKANGRQVYTADFTRYEIISDEVIGIYGQIAVEGGNLLVESFQYIFDSQEMKGIYGLQTARGLIKAEYFPMQLIGAALMGQVVQTAGDKVRVLLEIDEGSARAPLYWFVYSTMSASPNGSGWYCMPEIGDNVRIYFPSKYEEEAIALSAVSNYAIPAAGQDHMQDPNNRYLRTKSGQELALSPDHMRLSCRGGVSAVTVRGDGTVCISAMNQVKILAEEKITFHAEQKLTMHASQAVALGGTDGGLLSLAGGNIQFSGSQVIFD